MDGVLVGDIVLAICVYVCRLIYYLFNVCQANETSFLSQHHHHHRRRQETFTRTDVTIIIKVSWPEGVGIYCYDEWLYTE